MNAATLAPVLEVAPRENSVVPRVVHSTASSPGQLNWVIDRNASTRIVIALVESRLACRMAMNS
jgi:hypothetical protein